MAKINHLSQFLLLPLIGFCINLNGNNLGLASGETTKLVELLGVAPKKNIVKHLYDQEIGVREVGNNSGHQVEKYLRYVGLDKGNPWCAAFVCWVYGKAGISNPQTGWSPHLFPNKKVIWARGKLLKQPGQADIFAIYFADKRRIAHTGFIDHWDKDWLITVEGNTNVHGNREGDGVHRKRRPIKSIYQVARYVD
jgi:hypothetical protein